MRSDHVRTTVRAIRPRARDPPSLNLIDGDFMLGNNVFRGNLADIVNPQQEDRSDAVFLVRGRPYAEASRYGVLDTNVYGEIIEVVERPDGPPSYPVMTVF